MMAVLLYIWFLLTTPRDSLVCSIWADQLQTPYVISDSCGNFAHRDYLVYEAVDAISGEVMCTGPAAQLPDLNCTLEPLNKFRVNVIWPDAQQIACSIVLEHEGPPTADEIKQQCPDQVNGYQDGSLVLTLMNQQETALTPAEKCKMPYLEPGSGLLQQPVAPEGLATSNQYNLLAGELLWHGLAKANCGGRSGLDPITKAPNDCGLQSALPQVITWQNQWDAMILGAANNAKVPARLLKRMMSVESQFWPWYVGPKDETGMIQITDVGYDTALQYSDDLFNRYCPRAIYKDRCALGYSLISKAERKAVLDTVRASVNASTSGQLTPNQSAEVFQTYADVLAAYYCFTGEVSGTTSWENTLAVYHAGAECISTGEICPAGRTYIDKVTK